MRSFKIALAMGILASNVSYAGTYSNEVELTYGTGEVDAGALDRDIDQWQIKGTHFFGGVDDSKGPLAEAAFMDRASSIHASYTDIDLDGGNISSGSETYSVGGKYVDKASGLMFSAEYSNTDFGDNDDEDTWELGIGTYVADNTTLNFLYRDQDFSELYRLSVKHLFGLNNDTYLSIEGFLGIEDNSGPSDNSDLYGGSVTYYPMKNFGFGTSLEFDDSDGADTTTYSFFGSWFFNDTSALKLSYRLAEDDDSDADADLFSLGVLFRF